MKSGNKNQLHNEAMNEKNKAMSQTLTENTNIPMSNPYSPDGNLATEPLNIIEIDERTKCSFCDKFYLTKDDLTAHYKSYHNINEFENEIVTDVIVPHWPSEPLPLDLLGT